MTSPEYSAAPDSSPVLCLNGAEMHIQLCLLAPAQAGGGGAYRLLRFEEHAVAGRANPVLVPAMQRVLQEASIPLERGGLRLACVRGPGSFTGLRLTLSACLGLAEALELPLAGMDYLPLAARAVIQAIPPKKMGPGTLFMVTHARRRQVYCQGFSLPDGEPVTAPDVLMLEDVPALVAAHPGIRLLVGTGMERNHEPLEELFAQAQVDVAVLPVDMAHPTPKAFITEAANLTFSRQPIEPLYLRGSDAEENLPAIAALRGLSAEEAREKILRARADSE